MSKWPRGLILTQWSNQCEKFLVTDSPIFRISTEHKGHVARWLRETDNNLLQQGWQESLFISEQALILIYLLANDSGPGCEVGKRIFSSIWTSIKRTVIEYRQRTGSDRNFGSAKFYQTWWSFFLFAGLSLRPNPFQCLNLKLDLQKNIR